MKVDSFKAVRPQVNADDVDKQLRDVAKMYEGQFLREMVKSMRSTVSMANKPSMAEEIYTSQMDQQYVDKWTENGGIGLSDIIYSQLREKYFPETQNMQRPNGPVPLEKGTTIKVDETKNTGPKDMSYLFEFDRTQTGGAKSVTSPWDGKVQQVLSHEDRQVVKLAHNDGMTSILSFIGTATDLKRGDIVTAGQKLGTVSPDANGLTWQLGMLET